MRFRRARQKADMGHALALISCRSVSQPTVTRSMPACVSVNRDAEGTMSRMSPRPASCSSPLATGAEHIPGQRLSLRFESICRRSRYAENASG